MEVGERPIALVEKSQNGSCSSSDKQSSSMENTTISTSPRLQKIYSGACDIVRNTTVEPAIVGSMFVINMYSMLGKEYIYMRLAMDYNLTVTDREQSCGATANKSDPNYILQQKVSAETSDWIMYTLSSTFIFALFTTIFLGSWSDKIGRKIPMLISHIGIFLMILMYVIVVNLNLPVPILLVGHIISGLCGDTGNLLGCSFSYIADVVQKNERTFRMTVTEMCIGLGGFVAALSGAEWVNAQGFREPFWFLLAVTVFDIVYVFFRIPSTHEGSLYDKMKLLFTKEPFVHMYRVLKPQEEDSKRHINLVLYFFCFLIVYMTFSGVRDLLVVYEIGLPFCWNAVLVGISLAMTQAGYFVSIILVKIFPGVSAELKLVITGSVSFSVSCVVLAFSVSTWMIFFGLILQLCFNLPSPIIRSQASRLVSQSEVGSVFALLSCAQNIGGLLASFLYNGVFSATVESAVPGAAFLLTTMLFIVFAPLYWFAYKGSTSALHRNTEQYEKFTDEEELTKEESEA